MSVPFLEATSRQCRRPLWSGQARTGDVCGELTKPGSSYCPTCHPLMYDRAGTSRERREEFLAQQMLARTIKRAGATLEDRP